MMEARRRYVRRTILTTGITLAFCCPVWAKVIYVDDSAPTPGDGVSWDTAYGGAAEASKSPAAGEQNLSKDRRDTF